MGDLSPHFSTWEFRDKRTGQAPKPHPALIERLERARAAMGHKPIPIVSGYRSEETNRLVGGKPSSYHLRAMAADVPIGAISVHVARLVGFTGIGKRGKWATHVDVRSLPRAEWNY